MLIGERYQYTLNALWEDFDKMLDLLNDDITSHVVFITWATGILMLIKYINLAGILLLIP